MIFTAGQLSTLRTDIATSFGAVPDTPDDNAGIANAYNSLAVPAFRVWKTRVLVKDVKNAMNYTELIGRSVGERGTFEFMLADGVIDPSLPNIRQGIADVFSGASGATSRNAILAISKRDATRFEKLFATGTGTDAVPATMVLEGPIQYQDISLARAN